jgi:hypothetical protein
MPPRTFGSRASIRPRCLQRGLDVIVSDATGAARALAAAIDGRAMGRTFFSAVVCDDRRALASIDAGAELAAAHSPDERRLVLERLEAEQNALSEGLHGYAEPWTDAVAKTLRDFVKAGDGLLARSQHELLRVEKRLGVRPSHAATLCGPSRIPWFKPDRDADAVVIWGPEMLGRELLVLAYALEHLNSPLVLICRDGQSPGDGIAAIKPSKAQQALRRAAVLVAADIGSAADAIAFAQRGMPVAAASTSGAAEFLDGVPVFDPWNWRSVLRAVASARALPAGVARRSGKQREDAARRVLRSAEERTSTGPLVTIAVPTYNRLPQLKATLENLRRQTYKNIEILVVNDAGEPVDGVLRHHPRARLVRRTANGGTTAALNDAIRAARGEFIGFLADDDELFPDHVSRLVAALLRSKLKIAYGNIINRLQEATPQGMKTYGYLLAYDGIVDSLESLWSMTTNTQGFLFHRSVFDEIGLLNEKFRIAADYDLTVRVSQRYDVAHVDRITGAYNYCPTVQTMSTSSGGDLIREVRSVYADYPVTGRALIEERRRITAGGLEEGLAKKDYWPPPMRLT